MKLIRHIPNALTILRILLCLPTVYFFLNGQFLTGWILFLVAAVTDLLDGFLARRLGAITRLGATLDPLGDKFLSISFFALLMGMGVCPPWFLGLYLSTILLQGVGYAVLRGTRNALPLPSRWGKWNTALQFLWIGVSLGEIMLRHNFPRTFQYSPLFYNISFGLLALVHLVVFFRYVYQYKFFLVPPTLRNTA